MDIQFGMMVVYARDLVKTIEFYRLLGLDVSDPHPTRPVAIHRAPSGLSIIFTTGDVATRYDANWTMPDRGYQQLMEFVVGDDAAVETTYHALTSAGHQGRTAPAHVNGPYAAVVEDPDGNAVLITSDLATLNASRGA